MHRRCAPTIRRLGWDGNPIRRPVDRLQAALTSALLIMLLVGAPLTALLVADRAYTGGQRAENWQRATYRQASATVLRTGDVGANGAGHFINETVRLRWRDQAGRIRTGTATVDYPAQDGTELPMWIDASGALTHPPRSHAQTVSDTVRAVVAGAAGVAATTVGSYLIARRRLDRHRYRQWESDWATTAALWTRPAS
ncbi:MAG: hypothetical protein JWN52_7880 [Actinomycetia bacterium]|nr:hypothetical protein [Actinomycetes bacterium]